MRILLLGYPSHALKEVHPWNLPRALCRVSIGTSIIGSCVALIATSVAFATVGAIMLALKREFILTNAEVGYIGGAALWGFAVSQLIFAPLYIGRAQSGQRNAKVAA